MKTAKGKLSEKRALRLNTEPKLSKQEVLLCDAIQKYGTNLGDNHERKRKHNSLIHSWYNHVSHPTRPLIPLCPKSLLQSRVLG